MSLVLLLGNTSKQHYKPFNAFVKFKMSFTCVGGKHTIICMKFTKATKEYFVKQGKKGGAARKKALTAKRRKAIARKAARARWGKKKS